MLFQAGGGGGGISLTLVDWKVLRLKEGGVSSKGGGEKFIKILIMILGWNNIGLGCKLREKITKKVLFVNIFSYVENSMSMLKGFIFPIENWV